MSRALAPVPDEEDAEELQRRATAAAQARTALPETDMVEVTVKGMEESEPSVHQIEYRIELTTREFTGLLSGDPQRIFEAASSRITKHDFGGDIRDQPASVIAAFLVATKKKANALDPNREG